MEEINYLLEKYYEGATSHEEELTLISFFSSSHVPEGLVKHKVEFEFLEAVINKKLPESNIPNLSKIYPSSAPPRSHKFLAILPQIAAGLALILLGYTFAWMRFKQDRKPIIQITETLNQEKERIRMQLVLALIEQPSAYKRLEGIHQANKLFQAEEKVIEALFIILGADANVNVRLKALEAISRYGDLPAVREKLVNSLVEQDSPILQIAMVELMVALQENRSVSSMKALLRKPHIDEKVRRRIEESIALII